MSGQHRLEAGFTLVELMVSVALAMIALGILGRAFVSQRQTYEEQAQVMEMQQNVKVALHLMASELQMAGYIAESTISSKDPSVELDDLSGETGFNDDGVVDTFELMETSDIAFMGDVDGDNTTEAVRYYLDGTDLKRQVWNWDSSGPDWAASGGAQDLIENVSGLTVTYFDSSNTATTASGSVRKVVFVLTVDSKDGKRSQTLRSDVVPRNL